MESRLKKSLNAGGRNDRASEDASRKAPEDKFISNQERRKMWSEEWTQSALPKLPDMDGWHLCWLSTTNSYDSIDKRIRLGYVPVKSDELPGYEDYRVKSGEHVGYISCNEMLLFKLPMDIYQEVMTYHHHDQPREEAEKIRVQVANLQGQRDSNGKSLVNVEGEGIGSIEQQPNRTPVFSG
ncbi:MAG: hypothetical protein EBT78_11480 [Betaproteobacteria bacterium]|jgi:hypothetical protein|nr:hypothetical protein [Betaproteobacteria bacterium]NBT68369.1 hypothetical protein [Betaproteobacteria bacterium]